MSKTDSAVLTFIAGLSVGAAVALLLAPKAGKDLRDDLAGGLNDRMEQIRNTGRDLRERAGKFADTAQENVADAVAAGQNAYRQARRAQAQG